jgi:hypothetical protein
MLSGLRRHEVFGPQGARRSPQSWPPPPRASQWAAPSLIAASVSPSKYESRTRVIGRSKRGMCGASHLHRTVRSGTPACCSSRRPAPLVGLATGSGSPSSWSSLPLPSAGSVRVRQPRPRWWIGCCRPQPSMPAAGVGPRPRPGCPSTGTWRHVRHSYATAALAAGVPAKVVNERLGHANIAITMDTYSHVLPGLDEQAAGQVARLILGTGGSGDAS